MSADIIITSNADRVAAELRGLNVARALVTWSDVTSVTITQAIRLMAPVGRRYDPRTEGRPHMRDRLRAVRKSSVGGVTTVFSSQVGLYPYYVIAGVSGGVEITPKKEGGVLAWVTDGGQWRYAKSVTQGAITANPFNRKAWDAVEGPVLEELVAQLRAGLP